MKPRKSRGSVRGRYVHSFNTQRLSLPPPSLIRDNETRTCTVTTELIRSFLLPRPGITSISRIASSIHGVPQAVLDHGDTPSMKGWDRVGDLSTERGPLQSKATQRTEIRCYDPLISSSEARHYIYITNSFKHPRSAPDSLGPRRHPKMLCWPRRHRILIW